MKILFLNWAPIIKYGIAEGFRALGHDVEILNAEEDTTDGILQRIRACKPDYLFTEGGLGREPTILPAIERSGVPHIYWAIEDPVASDVSLVYSRYSVLTCTTHAEWIEEVYRPNGIRAICIPFACNPSWHHTGEFTPDLAHELAFVGNNYEHHSYRKEGYRAMFDPFLHSGVDIAFYGGEEWVHESRSYRVPEHLYHGYLAYEQLPNLCSSTYFILGVHSVQDSSTMQSMRTFDVLGCDGFFLTHHSRAVETMFKNHEHLVWSKSPEETMELFHYYRQRPELRDKIRHQGQQFVYAHHTYQNRAEQIVDALQSVESEGFITQNREGSEPMSIIIYPQVLPWNFLKQRPQHLMTQFGKLGHTVYFLNPSQSTNADKMVAKNVYVVENEEYFRTTTLPTVRQGKKVVVWSSWSKTWDQVGRYHPNHVIYDSCDDFPQWDEYESKMVDVADAVVCSAQNILDRIHIRYPGKEARLIRNGVDASFILEGNPEVPADLPTGKPIVGYVGAWASWIDHALMEKLLTAFPEVNFVVIGSPFGDVPTYNHSNLFMLGTKSHDSLPDYIRHFDVALIPFSYHPITLATNPIKAYEYIATGINTLSTALPECIAMEPYLLTATTHVDFINKLRSMLTHRPSPEEVRERMNFARENTWEERADRAHELVVQIQQSGQPGRIQLTQPSAETVQISNSTDERASTTAPVRRRRKRVSTRTRRWAARQTTIRRLQRPQKRVIVRPVRNRPRLRGTATRPHWRRKRPLSRIAGMRTRTIRTAMRRRKLQRWSLSRVTSAQRRLVRTTARTKKLRIRPQLRKVMKRIAFVRPATRVQRRKRA